MKDKSNLHSGVTEKEIKHAIRTCHWRMNIGGVDICGGNCNICAIEIERGRCDTLKELFKDRERKGAYENNNNGIG